jgi:hypothetical protein
VASGQVVADVVGDEVVIVNLDNGAYYSTEGPGCDVWQLLVAGTSVVTTATILTERYAADHITVQRYVEALADQLVDEKLLVLANDDDDSPTAVELAETHNGTAFTPAPLEKFGDMAPLLLLDPVHEVDDTGWPNAAAGN